MSERKLARVVVIDDVIKHPNADALDLCTIGGWVVVSQRGLYEPGDLACYFEIDSWVPTTVAPFLSKGKEPKVYEGVQGERLRSIKLRGELSQGLLIPLHELPNGLEIQNEVNRQALESMGGFDLDLTETLGVLKWERPMNAQLAGQARGNFPHFLRKSDQERVQNIKRAYTQAVADGEQFNVTYKLDGSSFTAYLKDDDGEVRTGVCSRNLELKIEGNEGNAFVETFNKYNLDALLREIYAKTGRQLAFQGEMCGPGIQGNFEGLDSIQLFVYNVFDIDNQQYLLPGEMRRLCGDWNVEIVPTFSRRMELPATIQEILELADGESGLNGKYREGLVLKSLTRHFSFKVISNRYLIKQGE